MYYINIFKKIFVNSVNMPLKQKVSVDYGTTPTMVFSLLDKCGKPFNIPTGAMFYIAGDTDYNQDTAPCFYSTDYSIDGNTITFNIETYTEEFLEKVKNPDTSLVIEIGMKLDDKSFVMLQDSILAQPRVFIEGKPLPSVGEEFYTKGEVDNLLNTLEDATKTYVDEIETQIRTEIENVADTIPDLADYSGSVYFSHPFYTVLEARTDEDVIYIGDKTSPNNCTISIHAGRYHSMSIDNDNFTITAKDDSRDEYPIYLSFGKKDSLDRKHFYTGMNELITGSTNEKARYFLDNNPFMQSHVAYEIHNATGKYQIHLLSGYSASTTKEFLVEGGEWYTFRFGANGSNCVFSVEEAHRLKMGFVASSISGIYAIDAKKAGNVHTVVIGSNADSPSFNYNSGTCNTRIYGTTINIQGKNTINLTSTNTTQVRGKTLKLNGDSIQLSSYLANNTYPITITNCSDITFNGAGLNTAGGLVKIGDDGKIPSDLIDVAGGSADLSNYVGGVSITGEIENYENKPVLNYEVKSDVPTIKIGNTENVIPADGAGMNLEQKADNVKIIAGGSLTLQSYKLGNSKNASIILSDAGRFDLASDVFSYYGNSFQIVAPNIFFNGVTLEALTEGNLSINNISDDSSTVNIDFNSPAKFFKFDCYWTNISFYFYGTPSGSNACITKEFFICPMNGNDIHTISIPWNLQIVGEMPTVLQGRKEFVNEYGDVDTKPVCHVFVARAVWDATISNWTYTINYAYNYCYEI